MLGMVITDNDDPDVADDGNNDDPDAADGDNDDYGIDR